MRGRRGRGGVKGKWVDLEQEGDTSPVKTKGKEVRMGVR